MAKRLNVTINFDMDGTFVDLYGVDNWLEKLRAEDETPYIEAKPLIQLATFARMLNHLQRNGYDIAVISWLSKGGSADYNEKVRQAKHYWLEKHLPSVRWDRITIVEHGVPKDKFCELPCDILFDDEQKNRENWWGCSYGVENIFEILKNL